MEKITGAENVFAAANCILNKPGHETIAAASFRLDQDTYFRRLQNEKGEEESIEILNLPERFGSLWISDCQRSITLDLAIRDDGTYNNSINKLTKLLELIEFAKDSLQKGFEINKEYEKIKNLETISEVEESIKELNIKFDINIEVKKSK